jgi:type I restriction enzyme S subunit
MKPYPKYKDSGIEWIGEIPEHWESHKLKRITLFLYGHSLPNENRSNGNVPVYGSNGISGYHDEAITKKPCIIIGRKGSHGKINYSYEECFPIDTTFYVDRTSTTNDIRWVYYLLLALRLDAYSKDSAVPGMSREEAYERYSVLIPKEEQKVIASYLDRKTQQIDELIEKKRRMIELLKEQRTAIINHAVTKGLNSDAPMKDSGIEWLGQIPENWILKRMRHICNLNQGLQVARSDRLEEQVDNSYPYITVQSINNPDRPKEYILDPPKSVLCNTEDILFARTGATGEVITNQFGAFHNNFFKINYDKELIVKEFLIYYLQHTQIREYLILCAGTTTIPDLNHGDFLSTPLFYPKLQEQKKIVQYLDIELAKIETSIRRANESVELLMEYRTALISNAVTGKIDVREG